eukprot:scaffold16260_cov86-Isochrysis_galbana.AAC.1
MGSVRGSTRNPLRRAHCLLDLRRESRDRAGPFVCRCGRLPCAETQWNARWRRHVASWRRAGRHGASRLQRASP